MRLSGFEFRPAFVPTVAAILALLATLSLGRWQLNRADEKRSFERQYQVVRLEPPVLLTGREADLARLRFRKLVAQGEFAGKEQIFIDNQVQNARPGYNVLTPLKLEGDSHYVLVNRGWIERGPQYPSPPQVPARNGRQTVAGYGALPPKRFLELSTTTVQGSVWQNFTFERYRLATGLDVLPIILVQTMANGNGLTPVVTQPDFGVARHEGYAFQWLALSATIIGLYVYWSTRRLKK